MRLVFPMAGLSSRFLKAGYKSPKYMLDLKGQSVFARVLLGFESYFKDFEFLFIYRNIEHSKEFIKRECEKLGLSSYQMIELEKETSGQAHTTFLGLERAEVKDDENLLIFNIDTFRPNFTMPENLNLEQIDGYLEVFKAQGEQWSFVRADENGKVVQTTEKERISNLCSSGLYYFRKAGDFKRIFKELWEKDERSKNEFYIAPMYNSLIKEGKDIRYFEISLKDIIFCGLPSEYEALLNDINFK